MAIECAVHTFPDRLAEIIAPYNNAIRTIFVGRLMTSFFKVPTTDPRYLSLAGSAPAFILAASIPLINARSTREGNIHCTEEINEFQSDKNRKM